jgi:hypothetical protein
MAMESRLIGLFSAASTNFLLRNTNSSGEPEHIVVLGDKLVKIGIYRP